MELILSLAKYAAGILPAIVLCLATSKSNLPKSNRGRQFILPFIAVVYCIIAMTFVDKINSGLLRIIAFASGYITLLNSIDWNFGLTYLYNTVIVFVFLALKGILLPIVNLIWGKSKYLMQQTSGKLYEYEENVDRWFLKPEYGQLKHYTRGFYYAAIVVSSVSPER